jgi:hypothetical protein
MGSGEAVGSSSTLVGAGGDTTPASKQRQAFVLSTWSQIAYQRQALVLSISSLKKNCNTIKDSAPT